MATCGSAPEVEVMEIRLTEVLDVSSFWAQIGTGIRITFFFGVTYYAFLQQSTCLPMTTNREKCPLGVKSVLLDATTAHLPSNWNP